MGDLGNAGRLELVRVCGELAIACEHAGDPRGAYAALSEGADALLRASRTSDAWKKAAAIFAHTTGYIARKMSSGKPLPGISGAEYVRPKQGVFYVAADDAEDVPSPTGNGDGRSPTGGVCGFPRRSRRGSCMGKAHARRGGRRPERRSTAVRRDCAAAHGAGRAGRCTTSSRNPMVTGLKAARAQTPNADMFVLGLGVVPLASEKSCVSPSRRSAPVVSASRRPRCAPK